MNGPNRQTELMRQTERLSGIGSWTFDPATGAGTWSEQMFRLAGLPVTTPDAVAMEVYQGFVHPQDRERTGAQMAAFVADPVGVHVMVHRAVRPDGTELLVENVGEGEFGPDGTLVRVTGFCRDVTEAYRTQRQLTEAHDLLVQLTGAPIDQAMIVVGPDDRVKLFNHGAEQMLGYTAAEMVGTDGHTLLHDPQEWAGRRTQTGVDDDLLLRGVTADPHADPHEWTFVRKDGERITVLLSVKQMRDVDGRASGRLGIATDVTERRRIEHELLEARDLFQQLLGAATGQAIFGTDLSGAVTLFNRGAERMLGWRSEEMIGEPWMKYHDPGEAQEWIHQFRTGDGPGLPGTAQGQVGPDVRQCLLMRADGVRVPVSLSVTPMRSPDGAPTGYLGIATDVTEQRRAEQERDEHAQMLRAIIDHNQSLIYVKDLEDKYLLVNRAFEEATGVPEAELLGSDDRERDPRAALLWAHHRQLALQGPYRSLDVADLPDGRHYYEAVKLPLRDAHGFVYAVCGLLHDVTERHRAEADSRAAMEAISEARDRALAANAAKSAFLATMSHEIRTPMNAVIGLTGLVLDSELDAQQRDLISTVRSSGDQLLAIINDILDFSKVEAGELDLEAREFDLREMLGATLAQFAVSAEGLELNAEVEGDVPRFVVGDQVRLRQVIANLVGNAVKFTAAGSVRVRARVGAAPRGEKRGLVLRFDVTDTGIGIPEDARHRLFRSFSQVDASTTRVYGGTGLGLAISRGLTEAMGGTMWVESTLGEGSTFSFTVQVGEACTEAPTDDAVEIPRPRVPERGRSPLRVLLAEDNPVNQKVGRLMLDRLGYEATLAANGRLALAAAHAEDYDVILMDMHMPEMDGLEATRRIRREIPGGRQPWIIALTASVTQEDRDACAEAGMNDYVAKPVRLDDLTAALEAAATRKMIP